MSRRMISTILSSALILCATPVIALPQEGDLFPSSVPDGLSGLAKIRPGDRISLRIWREPAMSDTFHVDERGDAVLPKLGVVHVSDLQATELRDSLLLAYAQYLRNPSIEITALRRIAVHGEVKEPGLFWVDLTMTLRDVIALAGGITPTGNPDDIVIARGDQFIQMGKEKTARLVAAELRSGDQVVVGRRSWFSLNAPFVISSSITVFSIAVGFILAR